MKRIRTRKPLSVAELQARARKATLPTKAHRARLSRSARLHLIDILSRWSGAGLGLIAGASLFIAASAGRAEPVRTALWLALIASCLFACARLRRAFRRGEKIASKPFRWRANYTSALSVLSAAFGAGALIGVGGESPAAVMNISAFVLACALGAGAMHIAHGRSALALIAPAGLFAIIAVWQAGGLAPAAFGAAPFIAVLGAGVLVASQRLQARVGARFPRTRLARKTKQSRDPLRDSGLNAASA